MIIIGKIVYSIQSYSILFYSIVRGAIQAHCAIPFNVSSLCNLGPNTLWKPRDKIAWVFGNIAWLAERKQGNFGWFLT